MAGGWRSWGQVTMTVAHRVFHAAAQGHRVGRWRCCRRAEVAIRAGVLMSRARMVAVSARANRPPAATPRARVRLNAMVAVTSQAALALNDLEGRWAIGPAFRSAKTCSMTA